MNFNIQNSFHIECLEKRYFDNKIFKWSGLIITQSDNQFIGITEGDSKELLVGEYISGNRINIFRFDNNEDKIYSYEFPNGISKNCGNYYEIYKNSVKEIGNWNYSVKLEKNNYRQILEIYNQTLQQIQEERSLQLEILKDIFYVDTLNIDLKKLKKSNNYY